MKKILKIARSKKFKLIKDLYEEDFPEEERLDSKLLAKKIKCKKYNLFLIKRKKELMGYIIVYHDDKFALFDYFAIVKKYRDLGYGTHVVKSLTFEFDYMLFEVEKDDNIEGSTKHRRQNFYKRLGCAKVDCGYKLPTQDDSGEIGDNSVFNMDFDIQTIRHKGQNTKRIFINNVESFDRGKGLYSELLNNYLPKLCIQNNINWIVLKAVAFDTNSAEKGGQQNLENFYKKLLFQKTNGSEHFLSEVICEKDFQDGLPLYCKNVQFQYGMQKNNYNEREFV